MKKKRAFLALLAGLLVYPPIQSKAMSPAWIWAKGNSVKSDVVPHADQQGTMIPLRLASESLGRKVIWNQEDPNIVVISSKKEGRDYRSITMGINGRLVLLYRQGEEKRLMLDHAP